MFSRLLALAWRCSFRQCVSPKSRSRGSTTTATPLPEGAVARIGSAKSRAGGYSQLSPDGKLIVSGYNTLAIREADTDKKLVEFVYSKDNPAWMFAFSTDNRRLAVFDGTRKLSVFDAKTGKLSWSSDER